MYVDIWYTLYLYHFQSIWHQVQKSKLAWDQGRIYVGEWGVGTPRIFGFFLPVYDTSYLHATCVYNLRRKI